MLNSLQYASIHRKKQDSIFEQETEGGKILSYIFDNKSFKAALSKIDPSSYEKNTEILIPILNNYITKTNYVKVLCLEISANKPKDTYLLKVECQEKEENTPSIKLWKIAPAEHIQDEINQYEKVKNNLTKTYIPINFKIDKKEQINYYINVLQINIHNKKQNYLVLEYSLDEKDSIIFSDYIQQQINKSTKPFTTVLDMIIDEKDFKTRKNHIYNHIKNLLNKFYSFEEGISSIYNITEEITAKEYQLQKLIGYYPPAELIISNARIYTEKEASLLNQDPEINFKYTKSDNYNILKSEIKITINTKEQWYRRISNNTIKIIDNCGKRYEIKYNNSIEQTIDIKNISREIKIANQDTMSIIIIGVEKGRKYSELDKLFSGMTFDNKERQELPSKDVFINSYLDLLTKKITIKPYYATTLNNINANTLLINENKGQILHYGYSEIENGDIASDFTRLELSLRLKLFSELHQKYNLSENLGYSFDTIKQAFVDVEEFISCKGKPDLASPINKDESIEHILHIIVLIRQAYLSQIGNNRDKETLIRQYYYSLLANSISIFKELFDEYYNNENRNPAKENIIKINKNRKLMYYLASYYINIINEIEQNQPNSDYTNTLIERINKLTQEYTETEDSIKNNLSNKLKYAYQMITQGKYNQSISYLENIQNETQSSEISEYSILLSKSYFLNGEYSKANKYYEKLSETKYNIYALFGIANSSYAMKKYKDAIENYKTVIEKIKSSNLDEKLFEILYQSILKKATSFLKIGRAVDSINYIQKTLTEHQDRFTKEQNETLLMLSAEAYRIIGNQKEAISIYTDIIQSNIENTKALNGLGFSYILEGDFIKAKDSFESSIFINKDPYANYSAYFGLREAILMEPSQKAKYHSIEINDIDKTLFQKAYAYGVILENINREFSLPRLFAYSFSSVGNNNLINEDEIAFEWLKPVDMNSNLNKKIDKTSEIITTTPPIDTVIDYKSNKNNITTPENDEKSIQKKTKTEINKLIASGNKLFANNKYEEARETYEKILLYNPENAETLYKIATCYFKLGNYRKAIGIYHKVYDIDEYYNKAILGIGVCYNELKEYDNAIHLFEILLEINPKYELAKFNKALSLIGKSKYRDASNLLEEIRINEKSITSIQYKVLFYKGLSYYKMGETIDEKYFENALKCFEESINNNDSFSISHTYLAKCKIKISKTKPQILKGSFRDLNKALQIEKQNNKFNDSTFLTIGNLLTKSGDLDHAIMSFNKALELNNLNWDAIIGLGDCYYIKKENKKAIHYYDEIIYNMPYNTNENKIRRKIVIQRKIRATFNEKMYTDCLSEIERLKSYTGTTLIEFSKMREICLNKLR